MLLRHSDSLFLRGILLSALVGMFTFLILVFPIVGSGQPQVKKNKVKPRLTDLREYKRSYKSGRIYQESKKLASSKGHVITTYYKDGSIMRIEEWADGKRNGITKVFHPKNILQKEIRFRDNYVIEYTAYKDGKIYTHISKDRRKIINKGRIVNSRWQHLYELGDDGQLWVFTPEGAADWMTQWLVPELVTQKMDQLEQQFSSVLSGNGEGDDMVTCKGETSRMDDRGTDVMILTENPGRRSGAGSAATVSATPKKPGPQSASAGDREAALDVLLGIEQTCQSKMRAGAASGAGGSNKQREANINKARESLDKAISECKSGGVSSGGLFSANPLPMSVVIAEKMGWLATAEGAAVTAEGAAVATETASGIATESATVKTVVDGTAAAEGSAVRSATGAARGFITLELAGAIVLGAAVVAEVLMVDFLVSQATDEGIKALDASEEAEDTEQQIAAEAKQQEDLRRERENKRRQEEQAKSQEQPSGGSAPVSMPLPDDLGSGSACERMKAFKDYCDNVNWKDHRCENYIRDVRGCRGDVRRMYVSGDGNVYDVGCPGDGDKAKLARDIKCKQLGMVSHPGFEGSRGPCISGGDLEGLNMTPDPRETDPPREFSEIFANTRISSIQNGTLAPTLNSKKPTLVVFMDPDCNSCQDFSKSLKDARILGNAAVDIQVVEASQNPQLMQQYGVQYLPSYFIAKGGKRTELVAGSMSPEKLSGFIAGNSNGEHMK